MYRFDEVEEKNVTVPFVVSGELAELSNHEQTQRLAQGERDDDYDDEEDEDEEREWCD